MDAINISSAHNRERLLPDQLPLRLFVEAGAANDFHVSNNTLLTVLFQKTPHFWQSFSSLAGREHPFGLYNLLFECSFPAASALLCARAFAIQMKPNQINGQIVDDLFELRIGRIKDGIVRMINGLPEEPPTLADSQENLAQRTPSAQSRDNNAHIL